jgi:hypothetical protein
VGASPGRNWVPRLGLTTGICGGQGNVNLSYILSLRWLGRVWQRRFPAAKVIYLRTNKESQRVSTVWGIVTNR